MSRYDRVRADGRPAVIQSTYCNRYCHYLFRPGHWCANVVPSFGQATFVDLPDQPGLKKNVVYKVKSFPVEFSPAKYILIFNMDSEKYLKPYNRTGWEFTAPWPRGMSFGITAIVTIPVSTVLLISHKFATRPHFDDVVWPEEGKVHDDEL